jgi:MFS superfamily sulfate permease-like transporter
MLTRIVLQERSYYWHWHSLTPLFYYIPHASLGVVIIMAVIDTITFHKLWIFWKTKR